MPAKTAAVDLAADEGRQQADRELGIGQAAHGADLGCRELRPLARHIEAAVARQARQQRIGEAENGRLAPRAHILHRHLSVRQPACRRRSAGKPHCASRIFAARLL